MTLPGCYLQSLQDLSRRRIPDFDCDGNASLNGNRLLDAHREQRRNVVRTMRCTADRIRRVGPSPHLARAASSSRGPRGRVLLRRAESRRDRLERRQLVEMRMAPKFRRDVSFASSANTGPGVQHVARIPGEKRHDVAGCNSRRRVVLLNGAFGSDRFVVEDDRRKLASALADRKRSGNSRDAAMAARGLRRRSSAVVVQRHRFGSGAGIGGAGRAGRRRAQRDEHRRLVVRAACRGAEARRGPRGR